MTWSIVARDAASGAFAVAVTTCNFAVGARCPFVRAGVGAVATQASVNSALGPMVLDLMARGAPAPDAVAAAVRSDANRDIRQLHAVDRMGRTGAWTGPLCVDWCGHEMRDGFSVAGNMLAGGAVVAETAAAFGTAGEMALAERLITALDRGQAAGGDKRGRQSAGLKLVTTEDLPDLDLRVDDHAEPLVELRRLLGLYRRDIEPLRPLSPRRDRFQGADPDEIEANWIARGLPLRFSR